MCKRLIPALAMSEHSKDDRSDRLHTQNRCPPDFVASAVAV